MERGYYTIYRNFSEKFRKQNWGLNVTMRKWNSVFSLSQMENNSQRDEFFFSHREIFTPKESLQLLGSSKLFQTRYFVSTEKYVLVFCYTPISGMVWKLQTTIYCGNGNALQKESETGQNVESRRHPHTLRNSFKIERKIYVASSRDRRSEIDEIFLSRYEIFDFYRRTTRGFAKSK